MVRICSTNLGPSRTLFGEIDIGSRHITQGLGCRQKLGDPSTRRFSHWQPKIKRKATLSDSDKVFLAVLRLGRIQGTLEYPCISFQRSISLQSVVADFLTQTNLRYHNGQAAPRRRFPSRLERRLPHRSTTLWSTS